MIKELQKLSAQQRAESYKLLSQCFIEPTENFLNELRSKKEDENQYIATLAKVVPNNSDLQEMIVEYAKLFVGPFKVLVPLYGSVYLDTTKQLSGPSTFEVAKWYKEEGLTLELNDIEDHISIELEFLYFLVVQEIACDNSEKAELCKKQKMFIENFLPWIPALSDTLNDNTNKTFYKTLAEVVKCFLINELELLQIKPANN